MDIGFIILGVLVCILTGVVMGCFLGVKALEDRCTGFDHKILKNKNDIYNLCIEIDRLKALANARKELELMVERKEKMSDYIIDHRDESSIDLAGHLYDLAIGEEEDEE